MPVLHRALLTWFLVAVFLILLSLRLDDRTDWDWFIIFVPLWIFDFKLLIYIAFRIITHCRNGHDRSFVTMHKKCWYFTCVLLKIAFEVLLSVRLQYYSNISWYFVMIPLWILLFGICTEVFVNIISHRSF